MTAPINPLEFQCPTTIEALKRYELFKPMKALNSTSASHESAPMQSDSLNLSQVPGESLLTFVRNQLDNANGKCGGQGQMSRPDFQRLEKHATQALRENPGSSEANKNLARLHFYRARGAESEGLPIEAQYHTQAGTEYLQAADRPPTLPKENNGSGVMSAISGWFRGTGGEGKIKL